MIVDDLAASSPTGIDGMMPGGVYPQRFGIPEGLYAEPVAVKQGWMCCIGSDWMHLSTGIIGSDHRYVMAIASDQPAGADAARATITQAVKTMFPWRADLARRVLGWDRRRQCGCKRQATPRSLGSGHLS